MLRVCLCRQRFKFCSQSLQGYKAPAPKLKQVARYLFASGPQLQEQLEIMRRWQPGVEDFPAFLNGMCRAVESHWHAGGPAAPVLVNHMPHANAKAPTTEPALVC